MTETSDFAESAPRDESPTAEASRPARERKTQLIKPVNAAKKLGILLDAAPAEFQENPLSRVQLNEYLENAPAWLVELRANGPHPRPEVARKLGVSVSGLARAGVTDPLTTAEISELLAKRPEWLQEERATHAKVQKDQHRINEQRKAKKK